MAKDDITTKFKVDISDLKQSITEANRQIKLANATFKAETGGMTDWAKSADGVSAKLKQLDGVLDAQKAKLQSFREQLERQQAAYEENGKRAEELKNRLKELAESGVSESSAQFKELQKQLQDVEKEQERNKTQAENLTVQMLNQEGAVKDVEAQIENYQGVLQNLQDEEAAAAEEAEKSASAYEQLQTAISDQEQRLDELKEKYKEIVIEQGAESDEAQALAGEISALSGELSDNKAKIQAAEDATDKLGTSFEETAENTEKADEGFTTMKGVLSDLVSTAIQAAITALKEMAAAAYEAWEAYDSGRDIITKATGATGEQAEELKAVYNDVSRTVKGSFDDIGTAIGEVNTRFGSTGDELQDLSEQFLKFAELNGTNVKSSIDSVQSTMAAFGLSTEDTAAFLDTLNKAGQDTGVSMDSLLSAMKSNSTALQEMGYTASDAAMFLANLDKSGVESSAVMTGLKKALQNAVKDGKPMSEAMSELEESIKGAKDSTEAITVASELFGSKAGAAIASAVRDGRLSFQQLGTSLSDFGGSVDSTYENILSANDMIDLAVQNVKVDTAAMFDEFLNGHTDEIKGVFSEITNSVIPAVKGMVTGVEGADKDFGEAAGKLLAEFVRSITSGIPALMRVGVSVVQGIISGIVEALPEVIVILTDTADEVLSALGDILPEIVEKIIDVVPLIVNALVAAIPKLYAAAVEFLTAIVEAIPEILPELIEAIPQILDTITTILIDNYPLMVDACLKLWNAIFEAIPNILPVLAKKLPELVGQIVRMLIELAPVLLEGAVKLFMALVQALPEIYDELNDALLDLVESIYDNLVVPINNVVMRAWDGIVEGAKNAWEGIKSVFAAVGQFFGNVFSDAWERVKEVFSTGGKIFAGIKEGIVEAFKSIVNAIIRGINAVVAVPFETINKMLNTIHDVDILGIKPFADLWERDPLKIPQIPELAKGGVLKKGQVGLLEGSGAEAVVPLENNKAWIKAVADEMQIQSAMQGTESIKAEIAALSARLDDIAAINKGISSGIHTGNGTLGSIYGISQGELNAILAMNEALSGIGNQSIYLDGKTLVGQMINDIDKGLGNLALRRAR